MVSLCFPLSEKVANRHTSVCLGEKYIIKDFKVVLIVNLLNITGRSEYHVKFLLQIQNNVLVPTQILFLG